MSKLASLGFRFSALVLGFSILAALSDRPGRRDAAGNPESFSPADASAAEAVILDRAIREYKMPDQIEFKGNAGSAQTATLYGDPSKPGLYIQVLKRPPNNWSQPHKHDHDRLITVISGTMWIGTGPNFDVNQTVGLKAGGFVLDHGNQTHFDGSKDEPLTIEIVGIVPPK